MDTTLHLTGKIADAEKHCSLHPLFRKAFDFLRRPDLADMPPGRVEIDGERCWANVQEADLKPFSEAKLETHRRYIDIQAPLTGTECIGIAAMDAAARALPFDTQKDYVLYDGPSEPLILEPGDYAVFFPPLGAHAPCCRAPGGPDRIKKVVVKVLAEAVG